jgi:hypothetical protein
MPRDRRIVEAALAGKGFHQSGGDHNYFTFHTAGGKKTSVFTKTSHSGRELSDGLLGLMAKQCRIPKAHFLDLVDCRLTREMYEASLISLGAIRL